MRALMRTKLVALAVTIAALSAVSMQAEAKCRKGRVRVRAKTPLRNGPGLNYPVRTFFEKRRCGRLEEVSADGNWVLMRFRKQLGWVPAKRLGSRGRARLAKLPRGESLPVGSGSKRKFAVTSTRMVLRERPQEGAAPRRVLPAEARILPLRRTPDGVWVEVRDDRGDVGWVTSEGLPKLSPELPVAPGGEGPTVTALALETDATPGRSDDAEASSDSLLVTAERPPSHRQLGGDGLHLTAAAFGGVVLPSQQLDSDAVSGERRYELSSMSAGLGLEIQVTDLGPIAVRLGGLFGTLEGLEPEAGGGSAGGTTLSLDFRAGWPLRLGALTLAPEVGYAYDDLSLDLALPGARTATFVSTSGHSGLVGLRVQYAFGSFLFEGEGAFSLGAVSPRPASLGTEAGLALGGRGAVDVHYLFDARFGLVARYTVDGRSVGFSGASTLDATISEAEVSELRQAILLGATYSLF